VPNISTTRDIKELGRYILQRTTNYFIVEFELVRKVQKMACGDNFILALIDGGTLIG